jgi:hypothetical protein
MLVTEAIKLHPNSLTIYNEYYSDNGDSIRTGNSGIHTLKRNYNSKLSPQSRKKLQKAITYMAHVSPEKEAYNPKFNSKFKFRLTFVTLTLSYRQQHSDTEIKAQLLQPFLDYMIKTFKLSYYVWKAERQANQNIHFHLIFDKYINYAVIRNKWNHYQEKLQYISSYWQSQAAHKPYPTTKEDYYSVNSTDVHSTRKVKDLARYMCKYMVKDHNSTHQRIKRNNTHWTNTYDLVRDRYSANAKKFLRQQTGIGRNWGCSYNLTDLKGAYDTLNISLLQEVEKLSSHPECYVFVGDHFKYISFKFEQLQQLGLFELSSLLKAYIDFKFKQTVT